MPPPASYAGVLVRQFDAMASEQRPWLPCARGAPLYLWCGPMGDRWPGTLINRNHAGTYSEKDGGLVFDIDLLGLSCGYAGDGDSMDKDCGGVFGGYADGTDVCVPGCTGWCGTGAEYNGDRCCWRLPQQMLQLQQKQDRFNKFGHNEIVVNPSTVVANLPRSVRAVFYMAASDAAQINRSRAVHAEFLRAHPHVDPRDHPLVVYDPTAITEPAGGRMPFTLAPQSSRKTE